ncbi:Cardiolipin synthase [compost metagenome]
METARQLLDAGIEVRQYQGEHVDGTLVPRYLHLKAMLIDGQVLSLGSANGDARTFKDNYELNTLIEDPATVADFQRRVVDPDWAIAQPLTRESIRLPFFKRMLAKFLEWVDFLF